jgi:hypothetical protein
MVGTLSPLCIEVEAAVIRQLRPEAAKRGLNITSLIRNLLDVVATDHLVTAILDDGGAILRRQDRRRPDPGQVGIRHLSQSAPRRAKNLGTVRRPCPSKRTTRPREKFSAHGLPSGNSGQI